MLMQSVHYMFSTEDGDKAEAILRELREASRAEPGVLAFEVARSQDDPGAFALYEAYKDKAALEAHGKTEHFDRLVVNGIRKLARQRNAVTGAPI
ncbi:MAG TPA: putative quinol monooxygenase [Candidatus Baltobacteraceae bacterium]|nr:putative quinol monooxygenase [Candidatus Baltobacteraceae bacterium]